MAADGKWIDGLHAGIPAVDAARLVLEVRLQAAACRLSQAAHQADEDVEHVHQLRVATRRAAAALRIFADLAPGKPHRRMRRKLRQLRRGAGDARDWDAFLLDLVARRARSATPQRAGLDFLIGFAHGRRVAAQAALVDAAEDLSGSFQEASADLIANLRVPDEGNRAPTLRDLALPQLSTLMRDLDGAAVSDLTDYGNLHQVRIVGKRLRYAMEIFESCFGKKFRDEHYVAIEEMQEILGLANDSVVAAQHLEALRTRLEKVQPSDWPRYRRGLEALLRFHHERLPRQRAAFERWWAGWRRSGGEKALVRLVRGAGGR